MALFSSPSPPQSPHASMAVTIASVQGTQNRYFSSRPVLGRPAPSPEPMSPRSSVMSFRSSFRSFLLSLLQEEPAQDSTPAFYETDFLPQDQGSRGPLQFSFFAAFFFGGIWLYLSPLTSLSFYFRSSCGIPLVFILSPHFLCCVSPRFLCPVSTLQVQRRPQTLALEQGCLLSSGPAGSSHSDGSQAPQTEEVQRGFIRSPLKPSSSGRPQSGDAKG